MMKALTLALLFVALLCVEVKAKPPVLSDCKITEEGILKQADEAKVPIVEFKDPKELKRINSVLSELQEGLALEPETDAVILVVFDQEHAAIQEISKGCAITGGGIPMGIFVKIFEAAKGKVGQGI
jgi:hypothetical protein